MNTEGKNRLKDKVAIITGVGSSAPGWGIGKATAVLFAREGAKVLGCDINPDAARETEEIIKKKGGDFTVVEADVSNPEQVEKMVQTCIVKYGRVDVLDNNCSIAITGGPMEISIEEWNRVIGINLTGHFLTCKYVLPYMKAQGGGSIINISAIGAVRGGKYPLIAYCASKGGQLAMTKSLATAYAKDNIRVNAILPGLMDTPMISPLIKFYDNSHEKMRAARDAVCPSGTMGDAWDVAYAALFLASDESKYINGIDLMVDGALSLVIP